MERYRKALVALVGAAALFVPELAGLDIGSLFDTVVGLLTAFGVFAIPNAPAPPEPPAPAPLV